MNERNTTKKPSEAKEGDATHSDSDDIMPKEIGGKDGLDPTRHGDWQHNGRCTDF